MDPSADPATESSVDSPAVAFGGARPVPSVGVWVGPEDEPARYERLEHVGGGAEGAIHRARFVGRGGPPLPVAIKQYRPPPGAAAAWPDDGTWHQIRDQAWLLAGLPRNDHLVRVREVFLGAVSAVGLDRDTSGTGKAFDTPFVVMEWIDGTAPDVLMRAEEVPLDVRLSWIEDLAEAVDVLHSASRTRDAPLVHADIKPGNCLVVQDRGLVLVDTGAVQRADGPGDHRGLRTPPYAAPEVLAGPGRSRSAATDLYSLGAVAFFLVTGQPPPSAERPTYSVEAERVLQSCAAVPGPRRAALSRHVRRLLAADAIDRGGDGATAWARQLRTIAAPEARRPPRRRAAIVVTAILLVGLAAAPALLDGDGSEAGSAAIPTSAAADDVQAQAELPSSLDWTELDLQSPPGAALYEQSFATPSPDWAAETTPDYTTRHVEGGGYDLHVTGRGLFVPVPAPPARSTSDEVVTATATLASGQGAWGVWCRGVDRIGSRRYEFLISHAGAVQIIGADGDGTGWVYVSGLDLAAPVTLAARCADVVGAPVELTLAVNGRTALTYRPATLLGPGHAGVEGMTFSDVDGPTAITRFTDFSIRRPR